MDKNYETVVTEIIANSGMARSCLIQAIRMARQGEFDQAEGLVRTAEESLGKAHLIQTDLIREEVSGEGTEVTLLMVHAQDHLMTAMTIKELAIELIAEIQARMEGKERE